MAKTASRNLTTGSPTRLVIGFLLPLLGGLLFQQLYNMVDTLVVGRFLGMDALAGVGSTSSVNFLVLGFCIGICNGFVIPVAQKFGEGDEAELRRFVANSIWLSAAFAVVLTVATALLCTPVLRWMNTPDNIFRYAYDYIFVIFLGIPAIILYNLVSGVHPFARRLPDPDLFSRSLLPAERCARPAGCSPCSAWAWRARHGRP